MSANGTGDGASAALRQPAARRKFWGWGLERFEKARATFADPAFERLLEEAARA